MTQYIATVLDTTGIQSYIFSSNRLRENIGASYLVEQATKQWVKQILQRLPGNTYYPDETSDPPDAKPHIDDGELDAEVVYAGGGNTVLLFRSLDLAQAFTQQLSLKILREAPGLNLIAAHQSFDWNSSENRLFDVVDTLINEKIERKKSDRKMSAPLLGLGVTADCTSTRLVAVGMSSEFGAPNDYLVSREVQYKLTAVSNAEETNANRVLRQIFQDGDQSLLPDWCEFPLQFDDLGRSKDESSYVAIVHADGNQMGDRFKAWGKASSSNRDYITRMRQLSWSVNKAGLEALKAVGRAIVNAIDAEKQVIRSGALSALKGGGEFLLEKSGGRIYLPFRPLVYGGDDVTFVCDGRLGLALAALYLTAFEQGEAGDGQKLTACAGVSIVKAHYPFARSYELSEALCKSAKRQVRLVNSQASALDWHIASTGLLGSLKEIRQREYQVPEGLLSLRPLWLDAHQKSWRNWPEFATVVAALLVNENWRDRRNKVIGLREELRQGAAKTKQFLTLYGLPENRLPQFVSAPDPKTLSETGWTNETRIESGKEKGIRVCGYFDAIEAMEFYFPLAGSTPASVLESKAGSEVSP